MPNEEKLPKDGQSRVGWAYEVADDLKRTEARFDAWAECYDDDVSSLLDWRAPAEAAKATQRHVPHSARILDAGAGTGLVGQILFAHGYDNIVATDISRAMLDIAEAKGVYRALHKANLMEPLGFADCSFDAVLSIGTSGYVSGPVIAEFARITAPGGHIVYTVSDTRYVEGRFEAEVDALSRAGLVSVVETGPEFAAIPRADADHMARVHVLQKGPA
ncbi:MAG: class I SAM-dependent DNA methyltransferase [Hyphomicrobiales bacterium]